MKEAALWKYVPLADYARPTPPIAEALHKRLKTTWSKLFHSGSHSEDEMGDGQKASVEFFESLFRGPDWEAPVESLFQTINSRLNQGQNIHVVVGAPHRATSDTLRSLATRQGWVVAEAPAAGLILENKIDFPACLRARPGTVLVIPQLAHWYLRHHNGLDLIRRLLEWIPTAPGPVLVGCHSWAWSYLGKVVDIAELLPAPLVLRPFDSDLCGCWLRLLAKGGGRESLLIRETATGRIVLDFTNTKTDLPESTLLAHIAGASRGVPEIAWEIWRACLLQFDRAQRSKVATKIARKDARTVWVPSWTQLKLPEFTERTRHIDLFLGHNLLLHGGLPAEVLPALVPFSSRGVTFAVQRMNQARLIEQEEGRWRISAAAYPSMRAVLDSEGYLVDDL